MNCSVECRGRRCITCYAQLQTVNSKTSPGQCVECHVVSTVVASMLTPCACPLAPAVVRLLCSGQCVGYFDIPVDHVYGETVILDYLASKRIPTGAAGNREGGGRWG